MEFRHYLVSGQVQGVGFRVFTHENATRLGLRGWVRNLSDGRVEILVKGAVADLAKLEEAIARGPTFAKVESIEKRTVKAELDYDDFHLRKTGEEPWQEDH